MLAACDLVSRDPNTGKATLYGIFERITPEVFPTRGSFWIYARFEGIGEHDVDLNISDQRGVMLMNQPRRAHIKFSREGKAVLIVRIDEMPFSKPGEYTVEFKSGRKAIGRPLKIVAEKRKANK